MRQAIETTPEKGRPLLVTTNLNLGAKTDSSEEMKARLDNRYQEIFICQNRNKYLKCDVEFVRTLTLSRIIQ